MGKIKFEDILTIEQLSNKIDIDVKTLKKWREKGMPAIVIDKYVRFYWPSVLEWMVQQNDGANKEARSESKGGGEK